MWHGLLTYALLQSGKFSRAGNAFLRYNISFIKAGNNLSFREPEGVEEKLLAPSGLTHASIGSASIRTYVRGDYHPTGALADIARTSS